MKVATWSFGCKVNQAEIERINYQLIQRKIQIVSFKQKPDFCLINACSITQKAERELRQLIHRIKRQNPKSCLAVIGCYSKELKSSSIVSKKVDFWVDHSKKEQLFKIIPQLKNCASIDRIDQNISSLNNPHNLSLYSINRFRSNRSRGLVKIQSGCQNFCSYCIVPLLRTKIENKTVNRVIQEIRLKEKQGFQEIVLVGINLGEYKGRFQNREINLTELLKIILEKTEIRRIRLSSLWPTTIDDELIDLIKKEHRICRHLHLSIQSTCDKILAAMNRPYSKKDLEKIIKKIEKRLPDLNLTADLIVGFPGEKEKDFQITLDFFKKHSFLKLHIFRYSIRFGTKAAEMENQVSEESKKERSRKLIAINLKKSKQRKRKFLNSQTEVLVEKKSQDYWQGLTSNYLKIYFKSPRRIKNKLVKVKLIQLFQDGIKGRIKE